MASESAEEGSETVSLGPELEEWLDAQAAELGVDRETVLVRLVATARAVDLEDPTDAEALATALAETEPVQSAVAAAADDLATDRVEAAVDEAVAARLADGPEVVEDLLSDRLDAIRGDFRAKLDDVRDRVVQVKKEVDAKAPADHTHDELARVDAMGSRLATLEETVQTLETDVASLSETVEGAAADDGSDPEVDAAIEELQDRLTTVAWVVRDLREAHESTDGSAALQELKREAARLDVSRANCERCGEGVAIALLTEPACPHCDATVTSVAESTGFFGKPQLLVASQLESGEDR